MPVYVVTYDLREEVNGRDYGPLIERLRALGAQRILESAWLVYWPDEGSAAALRRSLWDNGFLDRNDGLFVARLAQAAPPDISSRGVDDENETRQWLYNAGLPHPSDHE